MQDQPAPASTFGERLRRYRRRAGLSQAELAERAEISVSAVSALERGVRSRPYPHTVRQLADALGLIAEERSAFFSPAPSPSRHDQMASEAVQQPPPDIQAVPPMPLIGRSHDLASLTVSPLAAPQTTLAADATVSICSEPSFDTALAAVQGSGGGTITFGCSEPIPFSSPKSISSNVVIDGGDVVTLTGGLSTQLFSVGEQATLELRNIELSGGTSIDGGAIYNDGGTLIVDTSTLKSNFASDDGGAIFNAGGTVVIDNSTLSFNSVNSDGGAIFNDGGEVTVTDGSVFSQNTANDDSGAINNDGGEVKIIGSTFTENSASDEAGAIYNDAGTLTIEGSTLNENSTGDDGGVIFNRTGTLTGSELNDNDAGRDGGVIFNNGGDVTITSSTLNGNTATDDSGVINNSGGEVTITGSTLNENLASDNAGVIFNDEDDATLTIEDSTLSGNSVGDDGGVIYNRAATIAIARSTLSENHADSDGGAIYTVQDGDTTIEDSTLSGNSADDDAGAIDSGTGIFRITSSTLSGNVAHDHAGAINIWDNSTVEITSSTLSGNTSDGNFGGFWLVNGVVTFQNSIIAAGGPPNCINDGGTFTSLGYNLSDDDSCALSAATNDLIVDDVQIEALGDNGGPTQTHFPVIDPNNPILDAIPAGACAKDDQGDPLLDQRGTSRPQPANGNCDIGSVEVFNLPPSISGVTASPNPVDEGAVTTISAAASDPADEDDNTLTYAFDCDGDGIFEVGPQASAEAGCTFADDELVSGSATVTVQVNDPLGLTVSSTVDVSVQNVAPTIEESTATFNGGEAVVTVIASDPAGEHDPLTYTFDCDNDGAYEVDAGATNSTNCPLGAAEGTFTIGVKVSDDDGGITTDTVTVSVATELCANGYTGVLRYSDACRDYETAITLPDDGPVTVCANGYTGILRVPASGVCAGHEISYVLPKDGPLSVCVSRHTQVIRVVDDVSQCASHEVGQVIAATEIEEPGPPRLR